MTYQIVPHTPLQPDYLLMTLLYRRISSVADTADLQHDLDALQKWESTWKMEFNPSRCQLLPFSHKHKPVLASYTGQGHGQTLEDVDSAKYFGVTVD